MTSDIETAERYQDFSPSIFATEFWEFYKVIWEAERRFDLIFRRDHDVAVWSANRVNFYYSIAEKLGLYEKPKSITAKKAPVPQDFELPELGTVDHVIQTGANGLAADLRSRPRGCVYTQEIVSKILDKGGRVLLLHGKPETLEPHPLMRAISFAAYDLRIRSIIQDMNIAPLRLGAEAIDFWEGVAAHFRSELGIELFTHKFIEARIFTHRKRFEAERCEFDRLNAKSLICMSHYFRSAQIEAAQSLGMRTVDYQHGINSRYHLGYGYPNVAPHHRKIPYMPDEFWSWGSFWTNPEWFPTACCAPREIGHHQTRELAPRKTSIEARPEKTLLIATSWAMQKDFRRVCSRLADQKPDWTIRLKLHPREAVSEYADLQKQRSNLEILPGHVDINSAASNVRYVISICSSSLFDVLLDGCRIAIMQAPSVEYAEDFASRFNVPILEEDAKNFDEVVVAMQSQSIDVETVFHSIKQEQWDLLIDSISTFPIPTKCLEDSSAKWSDTARTIFRHASRIIPRTFLIPHRRKPASLLGAYQKHMQKSYDVFWRENLAKLSRLDQRVTAFEYLFDAGYPCARYAEIVRALIDEARQTGNNAAVERITNTVMSDGTDAAKALRAEVFEPFVIAHKNAEQTHPERQEKWREAISLLEDLSPVTKRLASSYKAYASSAKKTLADARLDARQQREAVSVLKDQISRGNAFTMMFLGPEDSGAFEPDWIPSEIQKSESYFQQLASWDKTCDDTGRCAALRGSIIDGLIRAEFLGVPSPFRLLADIPKLLGPTQKPISYWPRTVRDYRILFTELDRLVAEQKLDWSKKTLLDDRCYESLFAPEHMPDYKDHNRAAVFVGAFGSADVNYALDCRFFSHEILVPPLPCVGNPETSATKEQPIAQATLDSVFEKVDHHVAKEAVLFVSSGVIGKLVTSRAGELGGTAIEIGRSADFWMGRAKPSCFGLS